jgi:hypothetical protein
VFLLNCSALRLASLVRSRAKEFVELHDQVQVRVLLTTDLTCSQAKDERGLVGQPRILSLYVPEGPVRRLGPNFLPAITQP